MSSLKCIYDFAASTLTPIRVGADVGGGRGVESKWGGTELCGPHTVGWELELGCGQNQPKIEYICFCISSFDLQTREGNDSEAGNSCRLCLRLVPQLAQVPQPQLPSYLNIRKLVSNLFLLSARSDCQILNHKTYKERLGWGRGYPPLYELCAFCELSGVASCEVDSLASRPNLPRTVMTLWRWAEN